MKFERAQALDVNGRAHGGALMTHARLSPKSSPWKVGLVDVLPAATFCRSLLAPEMAKSLGNIYLFLGNGCIRSRVFRNKHSHSSGVARTSPITLEQGNGSITALSDTTLLKVAESITGLMR
ncbi:hypothetical protein D8674_034183 [Pyrus ussuriensis x Pyrus communis]|uniref:Uncharacterized protein n=1 Tax=Pyrus ussuriensis x Pyrus communis TaxID=2448454 RepID=A0A5N5HP81_9ROSA|nr:hypothetical protein D8674_034183 [Pyrus ussuriensis x Pyrus communis]